MLDSINPFVHLFSGFKPVLFFALHKDSTQTYIKRMQLKIQVHFKYCFSFIVVSITIRPVFIRVPLCGIYRSHCRPSADESYSILQLKNKVL